MHFSDTTEDEQRNALDGDAVLPGDKRVRQLMQDDGDEQPDSPHTPMIQ